MDRITVADVRKVEAIGRQVKLQGWIRTRRDSKGGFSFIELNDGSSQGNVQIVAPATLSNYESEVKHLTTGSSVTITGEVKESPAKGQPTEVQLVLRPRRFNPAHLDKFGRAYQNRPGYPPPRRLRRGSSDHRHRDGRVSRGPSSRHRHRFRSSPVQL